MTDSGFHSGPQEAVIPTAQTDSVAAPIEPNGPDLWAKILAAMPSGAIIAGGAVRDYLLGVEPKDIDVFMHSSAFAIEQWKLTGFGPLGNERAAEYEALTNIDIVWRGEISGYQVDAVGVSGDGFSGRDLVQTFDFGIARCWFDDEGLHDTAEAGFDRAHRTVTLLIPDRPERAAERFARFNARMNGAFQYEVTGPAPHALGIANGDEPKTLRAKDSSQ